MASKRVLVMSDLHCGHLVGLTPPDWQLKENPQTIPIKQKAAIVQKECWAKYSKSVRQNGPFDVIIVNGDGIDGRGERSGSSELISVDLEDQAKMAMACIKQAVSDSGCKVVFTFGTAYHTGAAEDWENQIAREFNASIGSHEWYDINGVIFDCKHHIGASGIPYGRHTASAKEHMWNALWHEEGLQPRADILIRSHVHYHQYCGDHKRLRMTTPALQAMGSKYGARRCNGLVHFGVVVFEIDAKGNYEWHADILDIKSQIATAAKL